MPLKTGSEINVDFTITTNEASGFDSCNTIFLFADPEDDAENFLILNLII